MKVAAFAVSLVSLVSLAAFAIRPSRQDIEHLYVDPQGGSDNAPGTADRPLQSVSAALARLPQEIRSPVTVHLRPGAYAEASGTLVLQRRMRPGVSVSLVGEGGPPVLDWAGGEFLVHVADGSWWLSNVQLGSRREGQLQGICAESPGLISLRDVRIRTRSASGYGLLARRAGRIHLHGRIELNEDLHEKRPADGTFCGILATDHGTVQFMERGRASLSVGNGSLGASYYGCVRLGCATARITSWTMSNTIGIGNSGRVDLHGTETTLRAALPKNALIGPEDDGHIMAEDTHVILESMGNATAIQLQKSSTLFGTNFEFRGKFTYAIVAQSGSTFGGVVKGDVSGIYASTGAHVSLVPDSVRPKGEVVARFGATIALPSGEVVR